MDYKDWIKNLSKEIRKPGEKLDKILTVRVTQKDYEWMKRKGISATRMFNVFLGALKEQDEIK